MNIYKYLSKITGGYNVKTPITYYSKRFNKSVEVNEGFTSDGATLYFDLNSLFWIVHDYLKVTRQFQDGTHCANWQASLVAFDILWEEKRYIHAPIVFTGVFAWGYTYRLIKRFL